MLRVTLVVGLFTLCAGMPLSAQKTAVDMKAAYDAHHGDFDFLLGNWEFSRVSAEFGQGHGFRTAVRLSEGQILDEFRVVSDAGDTIYVTTTLRAYNAFLDRWELVGMPQGSGLQNTGTGLRVGDEIHITQKTGSKDGVALMVRIRYYDIRADRFSWIADQSQDGGKTWAKESVRMEARRIGPARFMDPLAVAKR